MVEKHFFLGIYSRELLALVVLTLFEKKGYAQSRKGHCFRAVILQLWSLDSVIWSRFPSPTKIYKQYMMPQNWTSGQRLLPNHTWIHSPDVQQSQSTHTRLWWRKVWGLLLGKWRRMDGLFSKVPNMMAFGEGYSKARWGGGSQGVWSVCGCSFDWLMVRSQGAI